ncbi:MAG: hypothetical protein KC502_06440 [Myxococcales bacterium]|nr:hypothetical protein [Myxococcales bacterium]
MWRPGRDGGLGRNIALGRPCVGGRRIGQARMAEPGGAVDLPCAQWSAVVPAPFTPSANGWLPVRSPCPPATDSLTNEDGVMPAGDMMKTGSAAHVGVFV